MPTTSERNALIFLAGITIVGGGVRVANSNKLGHEIAGAEQGAAGRERPGAADSLLATQLASVDSARKARGTGAASNGRTRGRRPKGTPQLGSATSRDSSPRPQRPKLSSERARERPKVPVDINRATAAELEQLPRIGPALAARIIAWRNQHGPFRSMDDLRHVHGIGTTVSSLLENMVTF